MTTRPTATGILGRTPLSNLLTYALDHGLTGTLVVESAGARSAVAFAGGSPTRVKLPEPIALLGGILVELGVIDEETRARTVERALSQRKLHGAVLIAEGALDAETLGEALGEQLARKLSWIAALPPESVYGYYEGVDYLRQYGGPERAVAEPLALIWRLVKHQSEFAALERVVAGLGDRPLKFHHEAKLNRFEFGAREQALVDVLRVKPHTFAQLLATGLLPEAQLRRVIYVLMTCRQFDFGAEVAPLGSPSVATQGEAAAGQARPPVVATSVTASDYDPEAPRTAQKSEVRSPSPETEALEAEIRARLENIGSQTYYEILGIEANAPVAMISAAFFQLAKKYHPDRLGADLSPVRPLAERIFSRMTEAHQVLTNEEHRREYDRLLKEGGATADEQEKVQRVLRAATAFQKAEVLVRKGNLPEAEKLARIAHEEDPEQAEYGALYADILSQKPGEKDAKRILALVQTAKDLQPDNVKVRLYRGRVLKRTGDLKHAVREFEWVAERDPHNVEAAREVRLFRMRQGESKKEDRGDKREKDDKRGKPGVLSQDISEIFGKWFKR